MVLFFTSTICNKTCTLYTPPASISLAICRWCDICIFNIRNEDVVVVVVVIIQKDKRKIAISKIRRSKILRGN